MEILRIGDSAPEPLPTGDRPLSGIRVLDLTRVLAGPTCARTLAEHGADVMKITAAHLPNLGYQEWDTGHGKLSAELDLRMPGDVDILRGLVRKADVFSQGYRPGTLVSRGLSPEELAAIRPGLIYVSLCAFGHAGPWASRRGFDTVVQTVSGMTIRQAESVPSKTPGPQFYPVSAIDYCVPTCTTRPSREAAPTARAISQITGERMSKIEWGPNWEEILGGEFSKRSKDYNFQDVEKEIYGQFEQTFMMYLPRLCEHCLNPSCVASCPSGAIYKREEDGIVLIDQDKCRGWRMCITGVVPIRKSITTGNRANPRSASSAIRASRSASRRCAPRPASGASVIWACSFMTPTASKRPPSQETRRHAQRVATGALRPRALRGDLRLHLGEWRRAAGGGSGPDEDRSLPVVSAARGGASQTKLRSTNPTTRGFELEPVRTAGNFGHLAHSVGSENWQHVYARLTRSARGSRLPGEICAPRRLLGASDSCSGAHIVG